MELNKIIKQARGFAKPFLVTDGKGFRLKDIDPGDTLGYGSEDKPRAKEALATGVEALAALQDMLYAQDRWGVLIMFQAMDAAGKDGAIKHVMSGVNSQGCQVSSFKSPSDEDLDHDYMWRCMKSLPERGRIGIFNRSYYEETLVVRVHPEFLKRQKLPPQLVTRRIWDDRFQDIRSIERYLTRNGFAIRKFFLHPLQVRRRPGRRSSGGYRAHRRDCSPSDLMPPSRGAPGGTRSFGDEKRSRGIRQARAAAGGSWLGTGPAVRAWLPPAFRRARRSAAR